jgi:signal transduction histidine kinase
VSPADAFAPTEGTRARVGASAHGDETGGVQAPFPEFGPALVAALDGSDTTSLWFFDDQIRIKWASTGALRRRGWTLDGVVGRTMAEVFGADYRYDIADLIRRGLDAPSSTTIGDTPEDRRNFIAFPVDDAGARCVGLVSTRVTEWVTTTVSGLEHRSKLVADTAQVGIWQWDLDTDEVLWNEWHERLMGYEPGTPKRTFDEWAARVHPHDLDDALAGIRAAVETGGVYEAVYRVVLPNGELRLLQGRGQCQPDDPRRMSGVVIDLTPGARASAQEAALQRLAEAASDTERHRFTSDLHDGPIQDIAAASIYLSLIDSRITEVGGDAEIVRMAQRTREILLRATTDLRRILDELFTLDDDVDTADFENEIASLIEDIAMQTGIEVTASFDLGEHASFRAGVLPTMYRVAAEALRNAAKHAEASRLAIEVRIDGDSLLTVIDDDGRGFDPGADRVPGHYGLSLMDRRCRAAGGSVRVVSSPGAGTSVWIRLPLTYSGFIERDVE